MFNLGDHFHARYSCDLSHCYQKYNWGSGRVLWRISPDVMCVKGVMEQRKMAMMKLMTTLNVNVVLPRIHCLPITGDESAGRGIETVVICLF